MEVFLSYRLKACLAAILFGAASGVLYDVFRICYLAFGIDLSKGKRWGISFWVCIIFDLLYSAAVSVAFSVLTYAFSSGKLRLEVFVLSILGFAAYNRSLGRLVMLLSRQIISLIKSVLRFTLKWVLLPISLLLRALRALVAVAYGKTLGLCVKKISIRASRARLNKIMKEKIPESVRF